MKKAIAALALAGLAAIGTSAEGKDRPERERAMQRRIEAILSDSKSENTRQVRTQPAYQHTPGYAQKRDAAKLELSKELDTEHKVKVAMGLRSDIASNPEEAKIGLENKRGRILYTRDLKGNRDRLSTEVNAGRAKVNINISDYKHAQLSASMPIGKKVRLSAGHDSIAKTTTSALDYARKGMSLSIRNTSYPDGSHVRNASANVALPGEASVAVSHSHTAYVGLPTNSTAITLEKKVKNAPISRVYLNYDYATRMGQSYHGQSAGIEKKLDWLNIQVRAEKPSGADKFYYSARGNINLSW